MTLSDHLLASIEGEARVALDGALFSKLGVKALQ
jgi:hypothetical protein